MKSLSRSRSLRNNALPLAAEPAVKEREPFYLGPFQKQKSFSLPTTPIRNRPRANGENVPPDNYHTAATAAYVKANTTTHDSGSPAQPKSSKKGRNGGAAPLPGSPALLPRLPSAKPFPSPGTKVELPETQLEENLAAAKRKLHWDVSNSSSSDNFEFPAISEGAGTDSGVKVILRLRPLNDKEEQEAATKIVRKLSPDVVSLGDQQFTYDAIAGEGASQEEVFELIGLPMVENCLAGFNSSIFAYGQTGSGKTHTMMGVATDPNSSSKHSNQRGLTPRVIERLFYRMEEEQKVHVNKGLGYQCRCSFLEIYNEQITDLLEPTLKNLQIREDSKTGVYVDGLSEEFVSNVDDVTRLLLKGLTNRRTGGTIMNSESSRSHSVFTCVIESRFKNLAEGGNSVRRSRMNLVDLAGSERQKQTGAASERLKEAGNINKSLSQLGNVINILAEVAQTGKLRHIPYRDSRLTFLLQESLGGNAKLAMICAISPASSCRSETLSTLRFAQRAKAIQNKAVVNEDTSNDVGLLRKQIRQLKEELMRMKSCGSQERAAGGYSNTWNARRSYNLLRLSLSHPTTLSALEGDTEMQIDADRKEPETEALQTGSVTAEFPLARPIEQTNLLTEKSSLRTSNSEVAYTEEIRKVTTEQESPRLAVTDGRDLRREKISLNALVSGTPDITDNEAPRSADAIEDQSLSMIDYYDSVNFGSKTANCAVMVKTPEIMKISDSVIPRALHSPPQSVSPRLEGTLKRGLYGSPLAPGRVTSSACEEIYHSTQERFYDGTSTSQSLQLKSDTTVQCSVRASSMARPTEKLAACLQRGLRILDSQRSFCTASIRRSTVGLRSSIQFSDFHSPRILEKIDKGVQTSPTLVLNASPSQMAQMAHHIAPQPAPDAISRCKLALPPGDDYLSTEMSCGLSSSDLSQRPDHHEDHLQPANCTEGNEPREADCNIRLFAAIQTDVSVYEEVTADISTISRGVLIQDPEDEHLTLSSSVQGPIGQFPLDAATPRIVENGSPESILRSNLKGERDHYFVKDPLRGFEDGSHYDPLHDVQISIFENSRDENSIEDTSSSTLGEMREKCSVDVVPRSRFPAKGTASKGCNTSNWQLVALEGPQSSSVSAGENSSSQLQLMQVLEALLTGAIRRERLSEDAMSKQAAEIEQLNRLVRQYKHERECNAILHQSREEKIARLESLMDHVIPTDAYLNEEWSSLLLDYNMLQQKFDNHPEVTQSSVEQQRLLNELQHYRDFFDLGEREVLLEEVKLLRNQVQTLVEAQNIPSTLARQRRLSLARISVQASGFADIGNGSSTSSLPLVPFPQEEQRQCTVSVEPSSDLFLVVSETTDPPSQWDHEKMEGAGDRSQYWQEMEQDWEERERDWMGVLEELREEAESYKSQAERRKQELDCEKRCTHEMQDALEMAMTGHARLLEQYAELQEKHIILLAKNRRIKEGTADVKNMAKKAGVTSLDYRWLDAQALQITALKLEFEEVRQRANEEIEGLKAQLRDTADAVQAAGELLVRLKEAEESVHIAQGAAAIAEQDAAGVRRNVEKVKRTHATEVATLQQRLLESRLQKIAVCPMCVMAERVKFQFTEVDAETAQAALEAEVRSSALEQERQNWMTQQSQPSCPPDYMDEFARTGEDDLDIVNYHVTQELTGVDVEVFDEIDIFFTDSLAD